MFICDCSTQIVITNYLQKEDLFRYFRLGLSIKLEIMIEQKLCG